MAAGTDDRSGAAEQVPAGQNPHRPAAIAHVDRLTAHEASLSHGAHAAATGNPSAAASPGLQSPPVTVGGASSPIHTSPFSPASSNGLADSASSTPRAPASPPGPDAFAQLDQEHTTPLATWIHAGPHRAEAGYLDPSLGWVGVRAQNEAGVLHAAILPGSAEAAQALGQHMAGLNTYLAQHHAGMGPVGMTAPDPLTDGATSGRGNAQNSHAQQQSPPDPDRSGSGARPREESRASNPERISTTRPSPLSLEPRMKNGGDSLHISVIA